MIKFNKVYKTKKNIWVMNGNSETEFIPKYILHYYLIWKI